MFGGLRCGPEKQEGLCEKRIHRASGPPSENVFSLYIYIFVCLFSLVMPGLGFHTRNLQSLLRCGGSLIAACELLAVACAV